MHKKNLISYSTIHIYIWETYRKSKSGFAYEKLENWDIIVHGMKNMQLIKEVTAKQIRHDLPEFRVGDTVKVDVIIKEGDKQRTQLKHYCK